MIGTPLDEGRKSRVAILSILSTLHFNASIPVRPSNDSPHPAVFYPLDRNDRRRPGLRRLRLRMPSQLTSRNTPAVRACCENKSRADPSLLEHSQDWI